MTSPSGDNVTYNYDEANRLEQVGSFAGNERMLLLVEI